MKLMRAFLLIVFIVLTIATFWYWHKNIYSKEILKLEILSEEIIEAVKETEYLVKLKNNGKIRLENLVLNFQPPSHSILDEESNPKTIQKLEALYPGEEKSYSFKVRIFGRENENVTARAWVSYQPKNLKRHYDLETSFTNKIKFIPLILEFDLPSKIEGNEELNFSLNYFSNLDYLLENLRIKIEYPAASFHFLEARPAPLQAPGQPVSPKNLEKSEQKIVSPNQLELEWKILSLNQLEGGRIKIRGQLMGKSGEHKVFQAQLGIIKNGEFWLLKETKQAIEIIESSLYISQLINKSPNYIAKSDDVLHYEIFFRNTGRKPFQKKFLFVDLDEKFFDLTSLKSETGEYGEGDNTIIWDWKKNPSLRFLEPGEEGKVEFWIKVKELAINSIKTENPVLRNKVSLAGIEKIFETKLTSQFIFNQKVYFQQEFIENTGPLPPMVNEKTEYIVIWQIKNSWNDLENVKVKAILGENVQPTGNFFPQEISFTFDPDSREAIWNVDSIKAFEYSKEFLTFAFQIEFRPDSSQKGSPAILIKEAEFSAQDSWTGESLEKKITEVDTTLPDDETVTEEQGIVIVNS